MFFDVGNVTKKFLQVASVSIYLFRVLKQLLSFSIAVTAHAERPTFTERHAIKKNTSTKSVKNTTFVFGKVLLSIVKQQ